jgi:hypothetical protein
MMGVKSITVATPAGNQQLQSERANRRSFGRVTRTIRAGADTAIIKNPNPSSTRVAKRRAALGAKEPIRLPAA